MMDSLLSIRTVGSHNSSSRSTTHDRARIESLKEDLIENLRALGIDVFTISDTRIAAAVRSAGPVLFERPGDTVLLYVLHELLKNRRGAAEKFRSCYPFYDKRGETEFRKAVLQILDDLCKKSAEMPSVRLSLPPGFLISSRVEKSLNFMNDLTTYLVTKKLRKMGIDLGEKTLEEQQKLAENLAVEVDEMLVRQVKDESSLEVICDRKSIVEKQLREQKERNIPTLNSDEKQQIDAKFEEMNDLIDVFLDTLNEADQEVAVTRGSSSKSAVLNCLRNLKPERLSTMLSEVISNSSKLDTIIQQLVDEDNEWLRHCKVKPEDRDPELIKMIDALLLPCGRLNIEESGCESDVNRKVVEDNTAEKPERIDEKDISLCAITSSSPSADLGTPSVDNDDVSCSDYVLNSTRKPTNPNESGQTFSSVSISALSPITNETASDSVKRRQERFKLDMDSILELDSTSSDPTMMLVKQQLSYPTSTPMVAGMVDTDKLLEDESDIFSEHIDLINDSC